MVVSEKIIQPISEENPCGINIRENEELSPKYLNLKEIRNSLRREERRNIEIDNNLLINKAGWEEIVSIAEAILSDYSKDIEIAIWLLEGLTRVYEFSGLKVGLELICCLFDQYAKQLHPKTETEEEGDFDAQLAPIAMLSGKHEMGTIIAPIYFCELIRSNSGKSYNFWELKKLLSLNNKNSYEVSKEELLQSEVIKQLINDIDKTGFQELKDSLTESNNNFKRLNSILTVNFERQAPNLTNISNVLLYCTSIVSNIAKIIDTNAERVPEIAAENNKSDGHPHISFDNLDHKNLDKMAAMKLLKVLVNFFAASEPHSPISYTLARALKWSNLPLPEVLCDLMTDEIRAEYCRFSGVPYLLKDDNHSNINEF